MYRNTFLQFMFNHDDLFPNGIMHEMITYLNRVNTFRMLLDRNEFTLRRSKPFN